MRAIAFSIVCSSEIISVNINPHISSNVFDGVVALICFMGFAICVIFGK